MMIFSMKVGISMVILIFSARPYFFIIFPFILFAAQFSGGF